MFVILRYHMEEGDGRGRTSSAELPTRSYQYFIISNLWLGGMGSGRGAELLTLNPEAPFEGSPGTPRIWPRDPSRATRGPWESHVLMNVTKQR